jgi:hypothetical protein
MTPNLSRHGVSLRFWISQERQGVISWFEFIDFRRDIIVGSLFGGHQFLGKAAPKITLRCFHQPGHQIFRHSVDRSILIDFGVDRISKAIAGMPSTKMRTFQPFNVGIARTS